MSKFIKLMVVSVLATMQMLVPLMAQDESVESAAVPMEQCERDNPHSGYGVDITNFEAVPMCYIAGHNLFVVIDSVDNAVDIIMRPDFDTVRFYTDAAEGRHDLQNILRPVSVGFHDGYVLVLASAKKDSSFFAVIDLNGEIVSRVDFANCSFGFQTYPDEIIVVGKNTLGYDINILDLRDGIENVSKELCTNIHYHKPKQSDRIRQSDPFGVGLTVVAVSVVFLALLCIFLILKGYSALILKIMGRKDKKDKAVSPDEKQQVSADNGTEAADDDVYAAIAAAIYLYNGEMHDDESNVITFQKTDRSWTPWNAKYFNMNRYTGKKR